MKTIVNSSVPMDKQELEKHIYQFYDYTNESKWQNNWKYNDIILYKVNKQEYSIFFQDLISIQFFHNYSFILVFGGF